jgi:uncharacterized protein (TIGR00251 family)
MGRSELSKLREFKVQLRLKIQPNSKKEGFEKLSDGTWKLKIRAPAVEGKANERVIEILADVFRCRRSEVQIISGEKAKLKTIDIATHFEDAETLLAHFKF